MRTIKEILEACNDDMELLASLICLVFGYVFVAAIFWCNVGWQCGVLSVFLTYSLCEAACVVKDWMEAQDDEDITNENEHEDEQEGVQ